MSIEKIHWKTEFSIGNKDIDSDHQKILEIYNAIAELVSKKEDNPDAYAKFLSEMTNYALNHFKKEEIYMEQFSYPKLLEHKHYHTNFINEVSRFTLTFSESRLQEPVKILRFLYDWWTYHIQHIDRDYEEYRQQKNAAANY
jgi:hemerythrin